MEHNPLNTVGIITQEEHWYILFIYQTQALKYHRQLNIIYII